MKPMRRSRPILTKRPPGTPIGSRCSGERSTAWWVAGAGMALRAHVGGCDHALMPLKRVEPFVIRVDNTTGLVDVVPVYVGNDPDAGSRHALFSWITT